MQIACQRFSCMKAVEACYWTCKFRKNCKDWQNALAGAPGADAMFVQLQSASKKTGRPFDPQTLQLLPEKKNRKNKTGLAPV
jgi:hypothetical protein